jgi:hypothetical protein
LGDLVSRLLLLVLKGGAEHLLSEWVEGGVFGMGVDYFLFS